MGKKENYIVSITLKSIETKLITKSKKNRGMGNSWRVRPQISGLKLTPNLDLNLPKNKKKTINKPMGSFAISHGSNDFFVNLPISITLTETDPKFDDDGIVAGVLSAYFKKGVDEAEATIFGNVSAIGGDEPAKTRFFFTFLLKRVKDKRLISTVVGRNSFPEMPPTEPREEIEKTLKISHSIPISPGYSLNIIDPAVKVEINQALNLINDRIGKLVVIFQKITKLIQSSLKSILSFLDGINKASEKLGIVPPFSQPQSLLELLEISVNNIANKLDRIKLEDYDTEGSPKLPKIDKATQSKILKEIGLPDGKDLESKLKNIQNTAKGLKVLNKQVSDFVANLITEALNFQSALKDLLVAIHFFKNIKLRHLQGVKPQMQQKHNLRILLNNAESEDIGRKVTLYLIGLGAPALNGQPMSAWGRIGPINTPVTTNEKVAETTLEKKKLKNLSQKFALPNDASLDGSFDLVGNYGKYQYFAHFTDANDQDFEDKVTIEYTGPFEDKVVAQENIRKKNEEDYINGILTRYVNDYLDGTFNIFSEVVNLANNYVSIIEVVPAVGDLSNIVSAVVDTMLTSFNTDISIAKIEMTQFANNYGTLNNELHKRNLIIAELFPEFGYPSQVNEQD